MLEVYENWIATTDNVCELAEWLNEKSMFLNVDAVVKYFQKPWKWDAEYRHMKGVEHDCKNCCVCHEEK